MQKVVAIAQEDMGKIMNQIKATTKEAINHSAKVRWHKEYREKAITIHDPDLPNKGWITVQILDPSVPRDERQIYLVRANKEYNKFAGYKDDFEEIWNSKSKEPIEGEYEL